MQAAYEALGPRFRFLQIAFYALVGIPVVIVVLFGLLSDRNVREAHSDRDQSRTAAQGYAQAFDSLAQYGLVDGATPTPEARDALNAWLASLDGALGRAGFEGLTLRSKLDQFISQKTPDRPAPISGEPLAIIGFALGSDVLDDAAKREIATLASQLAAHDVRSISVAGHADTIGSDESNYSLAERRAAAVAQALAGDLKKPVPIEVLGYGERRLEQRTLDNVASAPNRTAAIYARR